MPAQAEPRSAGDDHRHILALDGLRGLAILLVIPHNADMFSGSAGWLWPAAQLAHAGWIGVQLFFVLSGFLITRNLLASRGSPNYLRAFFLRRGLRILPLYFFTLFVCLTVLPRLVAFPPAALASHDNQVFLWTFTSNWAQPYGFEVSGYSHFWSLAVEEQFYLLWPFVVLLAAGPRLLWACFAIILVAIASRALLSAAGARPEMLYMFTHCRMDALALGALAAALSQHRAWNGWLAAHLRAVLAIVLALLGLTAVSTHTLAVYDPRTLVGGQTLLAVAFGLMIAVAALPPRRPGILRRLLEARWLRAVGRVSFAMYVFHLPLLVAFGDTIRETLAFTGAALPLAYALAAIALSYLAAWVSWHLFEKRFLALKSRVAPATPRPAAVV